MAKRRPNPFKLSKEEEILLNDSFCRRVLKQHFYQRVLNGAEGDELNWPRAAEELELITGCKIDDETLRRHFKPVSVGSKLPPPIKFKDPTRWAAIYRFLTSEEVNYLHPAVLKESMAPIAGLMAMQDFLFPSAKVPAKVDGQYSDVNVDDAPVESIWTLNIYVPEGTGPARAILQETFSELVDGNDFRIIFSGMLLQTDSGFIIMVKHTETTVVRIWLLAQTDPPITSDKPIEGLAFWEYEGLVAQELTTKSRRSLGAREIFSFDFDKNLSPFFLTRDTEIDISERRHFVSTDKQRPQKKIVHIMPTPDPSPSHKDLFDLLRVHQYGKAIALVPFVEDINALDEQSGKTALHWAALHGVRGLLRALWDRKDLNHLVRNRDGRYPSELAWVDALDEKLGAELMEREKAYATQTNQKAWPKPNNSDPLTPG